MTDLKILILADDLTGALEVGAKFAGRGLPAPVICETDPQLRHAEGVKHVLVLDTETRHAAPAVAAEAVYRLACHAREHYVRFVYKKTDSTLRGNIGSELQALIRAFPGDSLVYAPAYPQLGRTVRDGVLFVEGVPVTRTTFAFDPLDPVRECYIPALLEISDCPVAALVKSLRDISAGSSPGIYLLDGEREDDIRAAARDFVDSGWLRLAAGPSSFADYLAEAVSLQRSDRSPWPTVRTCLVVNGSMHEVSSEQMRYARELGWNLCRPGESLAAALSPAWYLLEGANPGNWAGLQPAVRIGETVCDLLRRIDFDAVTVFGGDTAFGIIKALGSPTLHPVGEVLSGVPLSRIEAADLRRGTVMRKRDLCLITKAGGFGAINLLSSLRAALDRS